MILLNVSSCRSTLVITWHLNFLVVEGVRFCTSFVEKKDGIGLVADYVIKYNVPIAAGLEH